MRKTKMKLPKMPVAATFALGERLHALDKLKENIMHLKMENGEDIVAFCFDGPEAYDILAYIMKTYSDDIFHVTTPMVKQKAKAGEIMYFLFPCRMGWVPLQEEQQMALHMMPWVSPQVSTYQVYKIPQSKITTVAIPTPDMRKFYMNCIDEIIKAMIKNMLRKQLEKMNDDILGPHKISQTALDTAKVGGPSLDEIDESETTEDVKKKPVDPEKKSVVEANTAADGILTKAQEKKAQKELEKRKLEAANNANTALAYTKTINGTRVTVH